MRNRGSSLIEMLLVVMLTSVLLATLATLYGFSMGRAARSAARYAALDQANTLADKIEATVQQAVSCSIVTSGGFSGLKCTMPATGQDRDGDGYVDRYSPTGVSRRGSEKYGTGKRVWFYPSNSTGSFTALGTIIWRAERADDSLPTSSDGDKTFAYYFDGTTARYNLVSSATFSVDSTNSTATCVITASSQLRSERVGSAADGAGAETVVVTKTMSWRNWRK
jgi:type II secretory pathway pseudopilin PulG